MNIVMIEIHQNSGYIQVIDSQKKIIIFQALNGDLGVPVEELRKAIGSAVSNYIQKSDLILSL